MKNDEVVQLERREARRQQRENKLKRNLSEKSPDHISVSALVLGIMKSNERRARLYDPPPIGIMLPLWMLTSVALFLEVS